MRTFKLRNVLLQNSLLSTAVFTGVVFSISTHALWLIAGASATQFVSLDIFSLSMALRFWAKWRISPPDPELENE